jgi:hypothetical protein
MEKVITIPKNLTKNDLVIIQKEKLERLNKENSELKKAIRAILAGEKALRQRRTRTFRQFVKSKYPSYGKNI